MEGKLQWFPMRVTYQRELKIKTKLDEVGIESYIPMRYVRTSDDYNDEKPNLLPAIHNLIFVHSDKPTIDELKHTNADIMPLRYMTRPSADNEGRYEIIKVPDAQMENFIRFTSERNEKVVYLEETDYLYKPGREVEIVGGVLNGARGVIKHIKRKRCIVTIIKGVAAVGVIDIPSRFLRDIPTVAENVSPVE